MEAWVWRIPFVLGRIVGIIGLLLRRRMSDSPEFTELKQEHRVERNPLGQLLKTQWRAPCWSPWESPSGAVSIYMFSTYLPTYINTTIKVRLTDALLGNSLQLIVLMALIPFAAMLADRIGSRPVLIAFAALMTVFAVPLFTLISIGTVGTIILGQVLFAAIVSLIGGCAVTTTTRLFPNRGPVRGPRNQLQHRRRPLRRQSALPLDLADRSYREQADRSYREQAEHDLLRRLRRGRRQTRRTLRARPVRVRKALCPVMTASRGIPAVPRESAP
jgi:hypothetical protein